MANGGYAAVTINEDSQQPLTKPRNIVLAVRLIYVTLAISILSFLLWSIFLITGVLGEVYVPVCAFTIITLVIVAMFFLASKISQGRKWARTLFTVLVVFDMLDMICSLPSIGTPSPTPKYAFFSSADPYALPRLLTFFQTSQTLASLASSLISLIAVLLLFRSDSSEYFLVAEQRKRKPKTE